MRSLLPLLLVALGASALEAQQAPAAPPADPVMTGLRAQYNTVKRYLVASAEQMPEEHYGFRPVEGVRSFGEMIGHIVNAQYTYCSAGSGIARPAETQGVNFEQLKSKAEFVAALTASFEFCDQAYLKFTDAQALELAAGNNPQPRLNRLIGNTTHIWEHYGNLVTYMRIKGITPPSSQRG